MAAKKRALGKGLDALLGLQEVDTSAQRRDDELRSLPVDLLQRSAYQPRTEFDQASLEDLASSIRTQGIVQPIVVRQMSGGKHEIIAGERRWRAAQLAGLHEVPVVVRKVNDLEAMCLALIENIQRENLSPLEEARGFSRLLDEFEMTHDMIAEAVGRSRSTITNLLRLLDLAPAARQLLEKGEIEMGHGRALLALPPEQQGEVARQVVSRHMSVRETEALVRKLLQKPAGGAGKQQKIDPNIRSLQQDLSERLGASVNIKHRQGGKGTLEIHYGSVEELDGILSRIK